MILTRLATQEVPAFLNLVMTEVATDLFSV